MRQHVVAPSISSRPRFDWLLVAILAGVALLLGGLSFARYLGYNAGMLDLGNMAQAIGSVRRGHALISTFPDGPISRLALHVELIYLLFAPFYALWPDPRLLLGAQALLFALGALPVYRMTMRRTESRFAARCLALIYLFYPTAQTSVLFDFHGDTLAMPLLLWMLDALDRRAWRAYWFWLALALSCKFYVAIPIALLGALLWWRGERRVGAATAALGASYGALAFLVVRPLFTTAQTPAAHSGMSYISFYFGRINELIATLPDRLLSALVVFGPAILLVWAGRRWLLPALPVAAAGLLTTGPGGAFDYRYHHYAIVVPFIIMAAIAGVQAKQMAHHGQRRGWRGNTALTLAITLVCSLILVDTPLNPQFWLGIAGQGRDPAVYGITERDTMKDRFLAERVPPAVPLAASAFLAPHLADRDTLYLVRYPDDPGAKRLPAILPKVEYVLADSLFDWRIPLTDGFGGGLDYERDALGILLKDPAFGLVDERDGLLLFQRSAPADSVLHQSIESISATSSQRARQSFGNGLELVDFQIAQIASVAKGRRLRVRYTWRTNRSLAGRDLIAVSALEGVRNARFVHLPSYILLPVAQWRPGSLVQETFDLLLPDDLAPGRYNWQVGWYDVAAPTAADSDASSRVGELATMQSVEVR